MATKTPDQKNQKVENHYGLLTVDASSESFSSETNTGYDLGWTDMLEVVIVAILVGFMFIYLRRCYQKKKLTELQMSNLQMVQRLKENQMTQQFNALRPQTTVVPMPEP